MATILVVDNRPTNREFLVTLLGYRGHRLLEAADGAEALEVVRAERPALVITDILMPTMDGYEFVRHLRADPATAATPVLFYTAHYHQREARVLAQAVGVFHVLTKPTEPEVILSTVDTVLGRTVPHPPALPLEEFDREHIRVLTDKLSQKTDQLRAVNLQLAALIELGQQLASEYDPLRLLERYCHGARDLIGAKYSAIGILGGDGQALNHFFTSGLNAEAAARIGLPLTGRGLFGRLLAERSPLRLRDIGDPHAVGFPPNNPPLRSFLGVPITSSSQLYGLLYFIDKIGVEEFNEDDERLAVTLAAQVAVAYENAKLYEALRQSEERFQNFMNNSPAVAYMKDEAGRYVYVNEPLQRLSHRKLADWQGKTDFEVWPAEVAQRLQDNDAAALAANKTVEMVETIPLEDGPHQWLAFKFSLTDASGRRFLAGILVDITERKRAEARLQSLIDTTQDAVISIDRQGRIELFNASAERIFGYTCAEVQGQKLQLLMPEPYASEHDEYIARYERTGERRAIGRIRTVAARRKDGGVLPIELSVMEIKIGDEVHYGAFIRDVSEKVRLQEQLVERERLAAIGTTAATFAHEIGNPLNGMAVATQLLQRRLDRYSEHLDEKVYKSVHSLRAEIARLSHLLQEFRSLSRRQQFTFQPIDLTAVARDVLTTEMSYYRERGIRIEQVFAPAIPAVMADSDKLKQALLNLCKNAVEAMPDGGTLIVRVHNASEHVRLEVADNGRGIPEGVNIFEPFVTTKAEGTGLGLPIVRQIVAAHGGTLSYTSEPGKGTTFLMTLPLAPSEREGRTP